MAKVASVLLFLLLECAAICGTFYVATTGNDSADGSIGTPWASIQRSVKSYTFPLLFREPGDTVYIRGGLYIGTTNWIDINGAGGATNGTSGNPITIAAYPGEAVIVANSTNSYRGMLFKNLRWFTIDGITFSNCYQSVWAESVTNFVLKNCTFRSMPVPDISGYAGVQIFGLSQFNTVSNCLFLDWGEITSGCNDHGVSISIGDESTDNPMYYNLIVSNRFISGGHDHFQLNTAFNVIRGNLFVNAPWLPTNAACHQLPGPEANPYGAWGNRQTKPGDAGTTQIDMRNVFEGNRFFYTGPPPDDNGAFGIELGTRQGIYRFNSIAYSLAAGIFFNTSGTTSRSTSNAVYGNVLYGNGLANQYGGSGMQSFDFGLSMSTFEGRRTNNYIVNNVIWRNLPGNVENTILDYQQWRTNYNFTNNAIDPLFVSTNGWGFAYDSNSLPDFRVTNSTSPLVEAGTWLAYVTSATGSGTNMTVDNSHYFSDGNQIVAGDTIELQGHSGTAIVISNDYINGVLTLDRSLSWNQGQGVSLPYSGSVPDIGIHEYQVVTNNTPRGPSIRGIRLSAQ